MNDANRVKEALRQRVEELAKYLFPNGRREGNHWCVGDIAGAPGNSFKICIAGDKAGLWGDFADSQKHSRNLLDLWMQAHNVDFKTALHEAAQWAGDTLDGSYGGTQSRQIRSGADSSPQAFDWQACVDAFSERHLERLAEWRGFSDAFCSWLHARGLVGLWQGCIAFPIHDRADVVAAAHYRRKDGSWKYHPLGATTTPLVIGDVNQASEVHIFESQWDGFAACDKLAIHETDGAAVIVTRGAGNGALVSGLIPAGATAFAWKQNDELKNGRRAGDEWLKAVGENAGVTIKCAITPEPFKDLNEWTQRGASADDLMRARSDAQLVRQAADTLPGVDAAEQPDAEDAEVAKFPPVKWDEVAANSANSASGYVQKAILPTDSILADWFTFARERTEGADCYLAGVMLPILGAMLGRRLWIPLGGVQKYPNLFALICGKPGDRKSTTIRLAAALARLCLPDNAFIPASFSPESLFDEYDEARDGRPDKLWIADDANSVLTDWQKTQNGERNATRFLELYDCGYLTESFRRNKKESQAGDARRCIPETSTSIIFGATFNVACFQGQTVRAGMARRFLYYVAERRGCDIFETVGHDAADLESLAASFGRCLNVDGEMAFAPDARRRWLDYQAQNRAKMDAANPLAEDLISRLSSAPAQTLAAAMIFESAMWAKRGGDWLGVISDEALRCAIEHVAECLGAAEHLDGIAHRVSVAEDAEVIFERIVRDFSQQRKGDTLYISRSDLTRTYCHDSGRRGALKPHGLYNRLLPALARQGKVVLALKDGKREVYAFRAREA